MPQSQDDVLRYLLEQGKITKEQYNLIIAEAEKSSEIPDEVLEKKKIISEEDIAVTKSQLFNAPVVDLYGYKVDHKILSTFSKEMAENYRIVAFSIEKGILKVAMLNPGDFKAREAARFIARQNNLKIEFYVVARSAFQNILTQYSGLTMEVEEAIGATESRFAPILKGDKKLAIGLEDISKSAPIAKLVASILKYAVDNSASDIHIEPIDDKSRVRYRIDGILRESAVLPGHLHSAIISRIKVMANLKLDETRIPQDGRIRVIVSKRQVDLRVSVFPLLNQEKSVIRILDTAKKIINLEELGFWGKGLEAIKRNLNRPHGMILATGPTGCGKSTTLYALLKILNKIAVNIVTLEDPVEYFMKGVNQSQVKPAIGYTFSSGLRSVVRQDPDVIMVGEIRDNESSELAIHAALTGHIVLSTLHTNDAFGAVPRLIDMGIEPFLISSALNLVLAQRLTRRICPHCIQAFYAPPTTQKNIEENLKPIKFDLTPYKDKTTGRLKLYKGAGCPRCNQQGYKGRLAIFEVLEITDQMKNIINSGGSGEKVSAEFIRQGTFRMMQDGYIKVLKGLTTIEEILRVAKE